MHADAERRRDTREKIELGGLVVKAGLRGADRAVILGVLIEAAQHGDSAADPLGDAFTPEVDGLDDVDSYGEADHEDVGED